MQLRLDIINESVPDSDYSSSDEWYTPNDVLTLVRAVMGTITLDPASSPYAQKTVKSEHFYTKQDNGLELPWLGKVYCNPPYSQPLPWVDKGISEYRAGNVTEMIMLLNNSADTSWFDAALNSSNGCCLTRGRIKFNRGDDRPTSTNRQGQVFFYWGANSDRFNDVFRDIGNCIKPVY